MYIAACHINALFSIHCCRCCNWASFLVIGLLVLIFVLFFIIEQVLIIEPVFIMLMKHLKTIKKPQTFVVFDQLLLQGYEKSAIFLQL